MTDDERIDLSGLTPPLDDLVREIESRCAPMLAERRRARTIVQIAAWRRPMLAAAALIAVASAVILARTPRESAPSTTTATMPTRNRFGRSPTAQLATTLGIPGAMASRLTIMRPPTLGELLVEGVR